MAGRRRYRTSAFGRDVDGLICFGDLSVDLVFVVIGTGGRHPLVVEEADPLANFFHFGGETHNAAFVALDFNLQRFLYWLSVKLTSLVYSIIVILFESTQPRLYIK